MAVDYKKQYRPDQLEPFWPNEIIKMAVVVLCTLSVIMVLAVLPEILDMVGMRGVVHQEEPANPAGSTPAGIKPEWYFLAVYQHLRLMPTQFLGISGKTLGVLSQGPVVLLVLTLPFWYRKGSHRRPGWAYRLIVTASVFLLLGLTIWGGWPEHHVDGKEQLAPLSEYIGHHPIMFAMIAATIVVFYFMIAHERRAIRKILDAPPPEPSESTDQEEQP